MANSASSVYNSVTKKYDVSVNSQVVYSDADSARTTTISQRLNRIFADTNRDLDFITPAYINDCYVVCCPKVRKNASQTTYLYTGKSVAMKLYENTIFNDSTTSNADQTAILTIVDGSTNPWHSALTIANKIRYATTPNFNPQHDGSAIKNLTVPTNTTSNIDKVIYSTANCNFYGEICQGVQNNDTYKCTHSYWGKAVQRIYGVCTANGEVFHPMDLIAAMSSADYNTYKNKYLKVTYDKKSIVVKVVDSMPAAASGIELSFGAWQALGHPQTGSKNLKVELLK